MNESEYIMLKRKANDRRDETVKMADKQLEDELAAIDLVYKLMRDLVLSEADEDDDNDDDYLD